MLFRIPFIGSHLCDDALFIIVFLMLVLLFFNIFSYYSIEKLFAKTKKKLTIILNGEFELWHDFSHCGAYALVDLVFFYLIFSKSELLCLCYVSFMSVNYVKTCVLWYCIETECTGDQWNIVERITL